MSERYISLAEVKEILVAGTESYTELYSIQKAAVEHSQSMETLSVDNAKKLLEELLQLGCMTDYAAYKITDMLPKYPEDVRAIFAKERVNLSAEDIKQIIEIVDKYL